MSFFFLFRFENRVFGCFVGVRLCCGTFFMTFVSVSVNMIKYLPPFLLKKKISQNLLGGVKVGNYNHEY